MARKTFKEYLAEAPLPDDWDSAIYNPRIPFAKRVRYAQERAEKAGAGSSRVAFVIPYEGRRTILKVAKNAKGMAQNEVEARTLEDWFLKDLNITIPMIDYDEENDPPTWIHTEFAAKAKDSDFKNATGLKLNDLIDYCLYLSGRERGDRSKYGNIDEENDLIVSISDLLGNYTHVPVNDFRVLGNWGIYDGRPVIIDMGLDDTVAKQHYGGMR